ncbi:MAG: DUF262 domain-containing protein [Micromonosporaceae bacterium]|nr:DUF262 domain-containing protein [Micromonosporaceae bacterium]
MPVDRPLTEQRTPVDLVADVRAGRVRIPPLQRPFRWDAADVIALFDSLLHGYPIGNLLFWRKSAPAELLRIGPIEVDAPEMDNADWVVDGQQRITSLVGALTAPDDINDPRFRIYFDLKQSAFRSLGIRKQPPRHWLPVNRLTDTRALLTWYRENTEWLTDTQITHADTVAKALREYQIPTNIVVGAAEDQLRLIFDRLNNAGKPLRKDEVFSALHSAVGDQEPATLEAATRATADMGFGRMDRRLGLRSVLAYRGGDVYRDFHDEFDSQEDLVATFQGVDHALAHAVDFLQETAQIPHFRLLPYSHVVPVLVRWIRLYGKPSGRVAVLLRRWVWRGAAIGIRAGGTSVRVVRQAVAAVEGGDPYTSAQRLLSQFDNAPPTGADLAAVQMKHANAQVNLLGLLAAGPRGVDGQPIVASNLVEERSMTCEIVRSNHPLANTFANRMVRDSTEEVVANWQEGGGWLQFASPDVAETHLVDEVCRAHLREGDVTGFLKRRRDLVATQIERHTAAMAEWGARDGVPIRDLMRTAS